MRASSRAARAYEALLEYAAILPPVPRGAQRGCAQKDLKIFRPEAYFFDPLPEELAHLKKEFSTVETFRRYAELLVLLYDGFGALGVLDTGVVETKHYDGGCDSGAGCGGDGLLAVI